MKTYINLLYLLSILIQGVMCRRSHDQRHRRYFNNHFHVKAEKLYLNEHEYARGIKEETRSDVHKIRHHHDEIHWPVKRIAVVEGDIILGGLMMVHEREDSVTCGPIMPQGGVQALEAMLYTLDRLNNAENKLLPDIVLGAHILDDCDKDTYGLEMAVDFIKVFFLIVSIMSFLYRDEVITEDIAVFLPLLDVFLAFGTGLMSYGDTRPRLLRSMPEDDG
ncbi:hypothetical protein GWI33_015766 [Rhynchophorus ferrugineus]|uniref:Uncharacterized protein n=1 Tax=Rhynchophorus ferrugineus TaxID=354439 RepID=A0A834MB40_RHYFE|nr:hypothetical protein GWI33_015766 [Rhynchophorus ferrugineus]